MLDPRDYLAIRRPMIHRFHRANCAPTVSIDMDVDIEPALAWKDELNRSPEAADNRITLNPILLKATAVALREHILFNYAYNGRFRLVPQERIDLRSPADLGDFPMHIVIPETDRRSVFSIARQYRERLEQMRAKIDRVMARFKALQRTPLLPALGGAFQATARRLRPWVPAWDRWQMALQRRAMGTFMVTNMGMLGVTACHGQLVRPSIAALLVLAIRQDVEVTAQGPRVRKRLPLALEFDHRLADAGAASRFLTAIRHALEHPRESCDGGD